MAVESIRFSEARVHERLRDSARRHNVAISTLAEQLIDEGLRLEAHPSVVFRSGPTGRRSVLAGGPEVVDVIGAIVGGDVPTAQRRARASELLGITEAQVDAALGYYAAFTDEIDAALAERARAAEEAETLWRPQQTLLES